MGSSETYTMSVLQKISWPVLRRASVLRVPLLILLVIALGLGMGLMFTSPAGVTVSSLLNVGACVAITLVNPLGGFLIWLLLSPLTPWLNLDINFGAGIPDLTLDRVLVALILAILLAEAAIGKRKMPRLTRLENWMILTLLALSIAALNGGSLVKDFQNLIDRWAMPFLVYYVAKNLIGDRRSLDRLLVTAIALGTYCAIYGIYTQFTGNILFSAEEIRLKHTMYSASLRQMRGLLGSPHAFGWVFSTVIPVTFYKLIAEKVVWKKQVYAIALTAQVLGLFLTYKRAAWIGTIASFLVIQQFYPQFRRLFFVLLIVTLAVMGLTWDQISESAVATERVGYKVDTANGRLLFWGEAIDLWKLKPVFGYGWNGFKRVSQDEDPVENTYLYVLVSAGLVGLIPFVMSLVSVLWAAIDLGRLGDRWSFVDRGLLAVLGGLFVSFMINIFSVTINSPIALALVWALVGGIVGSQSDRLIKARAARQSWVTAKERRPI